MQPGGNNIRSVDPAASPVGRSLEYLWLTENNVTCRGLRSSGVLGVDESMTCIDDAICSHDPVGDYFFDPRLGNGNCDPEFDSYECGRDAGDCA